MRAIAAAVALLMSVLVTAASPAVHATTVPIPADPPVTATASVHEFPPLPNSSQARDITAGPDGNVWFSDYYNNQVDRMTPAGTVTAYSVAGSPTCITTGPDGNVWFVEQSGGIGRLTPSGTLAEFSAPPSTFTQNYDCLAAGPDGNLWDTDGSSLAKISPSGTVAVLPYSTRGSAIAKGPDERMWFGGEGQGSNAVINSVNTDGTGFTSFTLPDSGNFLPNSVVGGLTAGPDGKMWFTSDANLVDNVTTDGTFTQFPVPYSGSLPASITTGPDGNLWFTENQGDRIARVTPTGTINEVLLPYNQQPEAIASVAGKLWFTEFAQIGSLDPATLTVHPTTPCLTVTASVVLRHDVGPCTADGIVVEGSNITVDLSGHKVFAAPGTRVGDYAGIHLKGATGVTVKNGEVTGFDAGVWVEAGSGNTVTGMNVHDNLSPANDAANLGDGIVVFHSAGNHVTHNTVVHNGVFDGIGVLGIGSDNNAIDHNHVRNSTDEGISDGTGSGTGIVVNAFLETENLARGGSLSTNDILDNSVVDSVSTGISNVSNDNAHIEGNYVDGTGSNAPGNGIGLNHGGAANPTTSDVVSGNTITNILGTGFNLTPSGIYVNTLGNLITHNRVTNIPYGIGIYAIDSPDTITYNYSVGAGLFDLYGYVCQSGLVWWGNTYGTAYPTCTAAGGHQVRPPRSGSTASTTLPAASAGPAQGRGRRVP